MWQWVRGNGFVGSMFVLFYRLSYPRAKTLVVGSVAGQQSVDFTDEEYSYASVQVPTLVPRLNSPHRPSPNQGAGA